MTGIKGAIRGAAASKTWGYSFHLADQLEEAAIGCRIQQRLTIHTCHRISNIDDPDAHRTGQVP